MDQPHLHAGDLDSRLASSEGMGRGQEPLPRMRRAARVFELRPGIDEQLVRQAHAEGIAAAALSAPELRAGLDEAAMAVDLGRIAAREDRRTAGVV